MIIDIRSEVCVMIEYIGNVKMNYQHYSGSDLYSDGSVEAELLNVAKTTFKTTGLHNALLKKICGYTQKTSTLRT